MKSIIIGGGIAGLATAVGLRKKNIEVAVYESAPEFKPVGAGILLAPNGLEALKRIEPALLAEVQQRGNPIEQMKIMDYKGRVLNGSTFKEGMRSYAIHRSELVDVLRKFLPAEMLHTDKKLKGFSELDQSIEANFMDGTQAVGDLLVGTDGIGSQVRNQLLGELPYRYTGQTCWRGIVSFQLPEAYRNTFVEVWGKARGLRVGFGAVSQDKVYFFATYFTPANGKDDPQNLKATLQTIYKDFPPIVSQLINATPTNAILRNDIYDLVPHDQWFKGKVVLVGDAAHATTPNMGQGGNQALESAWVFSECMSQPNLSEAFAKYQHMRIKKAHKIINDSWKISQIVNIKSGIVRSVRNKAMQMIPARMAEANLKKVYALDYKF